MLPVGGEVRIATFPTHISSSSARVPDYPALDALMARDFGVEQAPVAVLVQNGVGDPGIGGHVAAQLVPQGFRVVFSSNADDFDHRTTEVIAGGDEYVRRRPACPQRAGGRGRRASRRYHRGWQTSRS